VQLTILPAWFSLAIAVNLEAMVVRELVFQ
jgi:hypothetical protein